MSLLILPNDLVSVEWLSKNIKHDALCLLDASWFMPMLERNGEAEWQDETIPGAAYFDFDKTICDQFSALPHMMPSEALFQQTTRTLGINQDSAIVVFDRLGIFSSPRVWWMFKSMGFNNVAVLDGGLNQWKAAGLPVCAGASLNKEGSFLADYQANTICDEQQVLTATMDNNIDIVDARPAPRFLGEVEEPRAGVRSGHMPTAKNLPFNLLIENGKMRDLEQLKALYETRITKENKIIFSCGSGVTACVLALGATLCGYQNIAVYDGSWTQWGADENLPVVKGLGK